VDREKILLLTEKQMEVYLWLKNQNLNTDDNTLNYWSRTYREERIKEVVNFAYERKAEGQCIRNIGGWVHNLLKQGAAVVNEESKLNRIFAQEFVKSNNWSELKIYEKYIRDEVTGDDLSLTMPGEVFRRSLENLFQKSILYK
jgi:hypothetical protein